MESLQLSFERSMVATAGRARVLQIWRLGPQFEFYLEIYLEHFLFGNVVCSGINTTYMSGRKIQKEQ